ncbi:MAG: hypothetical protein JO107_10250 [Hyphomicrobiales bacterium]|nr:hypothetical protein [Hyphomicrobiales bacterium]MBV8663471.1 hypothetical protein [Hyphomicrobiales bacterium]
MAKLANLPSPVLPWVDSQGKPTLPFMQFMTLLAAGNIGPLTSAANDAAAATAGVVVGGLYQNAGVVRVRLS